MTIDPFGEQEKTPSVSFKNMPIGTSYTGEVVEAPQIVQSRDYDTNEPLFWQPNGKPGPNPTEQQVKSILTVLEINGERRGLWASKWAKPGSMFSAIQEAQKEAGAQIAVGGTLTVSIVGVEPSKDPKFSDRKLYAARYTPPNPFAEQGSGGAAPVAQQHIDPHTGEVTNQGPMPDWAQPQQSPPPGQQYMTSSAAHPQPIQQQPAHAAQAAYAQTAPQQAKQHSPEVLAALQMAGVDPASVPVK